MRATSFTDSYGEPRIVWVLALFFGGIVILAVTIACTVATVSYNVDKHRCTQYAKTYNRQTEFVKYSYWSHDCLTPDDQGHMIPISNVKLVVNQ